MATMQENLIKNLLASNRDLATALEQAYEFIKQKQAHDGPMDKETLERAKQAWEANTIRIETGRWAGDSVNFDVAKARQVLADAKRKFANLWEPQ